MLKFNNGLGANICDICRIIIKEPYDVRIGPTYSLCDTCKNDINKDNLKQVICIRTDLNMRKGKMVSQGAHASMKVFFDRMSNSGGGSWECNMTKEMEIWTQTIFTKIVVKCDSEKKLLDTYNKTVIAKIPCALIQDCGLTEFKGVPTYTCIAIGPDVSSKIDLITGEFQLL